LALFFRDLGLYKQSIQAAGTVLRLAGSNALQAPQFLGRLAYPVYYHELVSQAAAENHTDPLVVFALIRQESLFEGFATSSVYASGLMQVMPATGSYIARRLGVDNFESSDLYRPTVSIRFGTWYLAEQINRFQGDVTAALAGYNAGPGRSAQWRDQANGDPDAFYQLISLNEPKLYVERITQYYQVYKALYGVQP
jgi:soluble lytic murein transglycosylase